MRKALNYKAIFLAAVLGGSALAYGSREVVLDEAIEARSPVMLKFATKVLRADINTWDRRQDLALGMGLIGDSKGDVEFLLRSGGVDKGTKETLMVAAANLGHTDVIDMVLVSGVSQNTLNLALQQGGLSDPAMTAYLLKKGAKPNEPIHLSPDLTHPEGTILAWAALQRHEMRDSVIKVLLDHGAKPELAITVLKSYSDEGKDVAESIRAIERIVEERRSGSRKVVTSFFAIPRPA